MPPTPLEIVKADIEAYKAVLSHLPDKQKEGFVSRATVEDFNTLLKKAADAVPEMAPHLPTKIFTHYRDRLSSQKFAEIEILVERVLRLIQLYQKG